MKVEDLIKTNDFCAVTTDKLEEFGVVEGDVVYIAGHQPYPENEDDPYWFRLKMLCVRTKDGHVQADDKMLVIDPANLEKVDEEMQEGLTLLINKDFAEEGEEEDVTTH